MNIISVLRKAAPSRKQTNQTRPVNPHKARLFILLSALLSLAIPLHAHAILLWAKPSLKAVVRGPDVPVLLRFNCRIDAKRSKLILVDPHGAQHEMVIDSQTSPDMLGTRATGLEHGSYTLQWRVLASDGHITRGDVPFSVQ